MEQKVNYLSTIQRFNKIVDGLDMHSTMQVGDHLRQMRLEVIQTAVTYERLTPTFSHILFAAFSSYEDCLDIRSYEEAVEQRRMAVMGNLYNLFTRMPRPAIIMAAIQPVLLSEAISDTFKALFEAADFHRWRGTYPLRFEHPEQVLVDDTVCFVLERTMEPANDVVLRNSGSDRFPYELVDHDVCYRFRDFSQVEAHIKTHVKTHLAYWNLKENRSDT